MLISAWQLASTRSVCANRFKRSSCEWAHVTNLMSSSKTQHEVHLLLRHQLQDVVGVGGGEHLLESGVQQVTHGRQDGLIVVDYKYRSVVFHGAKVRNNCQILIQRGGTQLNSIWKMRKLKTSAKTKKLPCTLFNSVRGYNTPSIKLNLNSIPCVARAMQLNWELNWTQFERCEN